MKRSGIGSFLLQEVPITDHEALYQHARFCERAVELWTHDHLWTYRYEFELLVLGQLLHKFPGSFFGHSFGIGVRSFDGRGGQAINPSSRRGGRGPRGIEVGTYVPSIVVSVHQSSSVKILPAVCVFLFSIAAPEEVTTTRFQMKKRQQKQPNV